MANVALAQPPEKRGPTIALDFHDVHADRPLRRPHELLLDVVAEFHVTVHGATAFEQPEFPIVELASQLNQWLKAKPLQDFHYKSMESALPWLLAFRRASADWQFVSAYSKDAQGFRMPEEAVATACRRFIEQVASETRKTLNVDVSTFLA